MSRWNECKRCNRAFGTISSRGRAFCFTCRPRKSRRHDLTKFVKTDGGKSLIGEQKDCTVRSLAVAGQLLYADAHAAMQLAGRKNCHGGHVERGLAICAKMGMLDYQVVKLVEYHEAVYSRTDALFTYAELSGHTTAHDGTGGRVMVRSSASRPVTLAMVRDKLSTGRYILNSRNHSFAMIDGVVHDQWNVGPNTQIEAVFSIKAVRA